ncbi:MAG: hypothetical protein IKH15_00185 [Bacteroidales bacterium]|nr:hypothetical protein [Bacteroidales bacterium]
MKNKIVFWFFLLVFAVANCFAQEYEDVWDLDQDSLRLFYRDISKWDLYIEPFTYVTQESTFDEFGLKKGYFTNGFFIRAVPKTQEGVQKPDEIAYRFYNYYMYEIPVAGIDNSYFAIIRNTVFPYAKNYPVETNVRTLFDKFCEKHFKDNLERCVLMIDSNLRTDYEYYPLWGTRHSKMQYYGEQYGYTDVGMHNSVGNPIQGTNDSLWLSQKVMIPHKTVIVYVQNHSIPDAWTKKLWYSLSDNIVGFCDISSVSEIPNKKYSILNKNIILHYHDKYHLYSEEWTGFMKQQLLDSITSIEGNRTRVFQQKDILHDTSVKISNIFPRGICFTYDTPDSWRGWKDYGFIITSEKDTIRRFVNHENPLFNYYMHLQDTCGGGITYNTDFDYDGSPFVEYILGKRCLTDEELSNHLYSKHYDYRSNIDTLLLTERQQSQIRKDLLKLAKLDAQLKQIEIQSETYRKFQYRDSDEFFVKKTQNLYSYDEENGTEIVSPKYRKKVEKIEKEKEKIANKLRGKGVYTHSYSSHIIYS